MFPTNLSLAPDGRLLIDWSTGQRRSYSVSELRGACPCATCREKRNQPEPEPTPGKAVLLPILTAAEAQPLKLLGMKPVGNYAYGIQFSDGHDTGIFTFELLSQLGRVEPPGG